MAYCVGSLTANSGRLGKASLGRLTQSHQNMTRSPLRTALRSAAVLGFATLAIGGEAQAVTVGFLRANPTHTITVGDKTVSNISFGGDVVDTDEFNFTNPLGGSNYQVAMNFVNADGNPSVSGSMTYDIAVTSGTDKIATVAVDADCGPVSSAAGNCTRSLTTTASMNFTPVTLANNLASFTPAVTSTTTTSTWAAVGTGSYINAVSDKYTQIAAPVDAVPGPLPILGAGLAFGYSRRLRARLKKAAA